ncbi:hypothetical protein AT746_16815 [Lacimicrobium alkaliphilum]|uniref:Beta-lactamase-related domain-containing protein n=1 Tax=Lacimicrobium alkaliphilum TaxID=1526571 RepID=A0A0U2ZB89_9ALTE|nr:hypothetical protein AT746_16815 [Lacimicrobium alkaliphilum]
MSAEDVPAISFALISDRQVIFSYATGVSNTETGEPVNDQSIFEAASLSKPVFAYSVLRFAEQGLIDLDKPLYQYLPFAELEARDTRYHSVTARMVLSHTTGFPNWRWFDPAPEALNLQRGTMYQKKPPGEFSYSGEAYHYLARVMMRLTQTSEVSFEEKLLEHTQPMQALPFYWTWEPSLAVHKVSGHKDGKPTGTEWPMSYPDDTPDKIGVAGRLHTNARAYASFLAGLFSGHYLSPHSLLSMLTPQSQVPPDSYDYTENHLVAWGLGVGLGASAYGARFFHGGNNGDFQSGFSVYGQGDIGMVFFTNGNAGERLHKKLEEVLINGTL